MWRSLKRTSAQLVGNRCNSFSYRYFLLFYLIYLRPLMPPITVSFLIFYCLLFHFHLKHFSVFFSLCAKLNWLLAYQFFSTNRPSYRIVYHGRLLRYGASKILWSRPWLLESRDVIGHVVIRSAVPEYPTLQPKRKWIWCLVAEIWSLEVFQEVRSVVNIHYADVIH